MYFITFVKKLTVHASADRQQECEHIDLQVLSTSVASALAYYNDPSTTETEHFCRQFDRFFDCMNVRSKSE